VSSINLIWSISSNKIQSVVHSRCEWLKLFQFMTYNVSSGTLSPTSSMLLKLK